MVTDPLREVEALLRRAEPVNESVSPAILRQWRSELVRASVFLSYAIGVLSLDSAILERAQTSLVDDVMASLIDDLPGLLASGWVGGGWSLAPEASASVAAANEFALDDAAGLLDLHGEMVASDLNSAGVVDDLLARISLRRETYLLLREQIEARLSSIQEVMRAHYASGAASVDDWLD